LEGVPFFKPPPTSQKEKPKPVKKIPKNQLMEKLTNAERYFKTVSYFFVFLLGMHYLCSLKR
jgi:hypothetical protein